MVNILVLKEGDKDKLERLFFYSRLSKSYVLLDESTREAFERCICCSMNKEVLRI